MPPTVRPGQPVRASAINEIGAEAALIRKLRGEGVSASASGITLAIRPTMPAGPNCVKARLISPDSAPLWGVGALGAADEGRYAGALVQISRPVFSCLGHLGIFKWGVSVNTLSWAQIAGFSPVLYDLATIPAGVTLGDGHRLGCKMESYIAQWDVGGPLFVHSTQGTMVVNEVTYGVAIVEITRKRLNSKLVNTGGQCDGAYETIIFSPEEYSVAPTAGSYGDTTVTYVP